MPSPRQGEPDARAPRKPRNRNHIPQNKQAPGLQPRGEHSGCAARSCTQQTARARTENDRGELWRLNRCPPWRWIGLLQEAFNVGFKMEECRKGVKLSIEVLVVCRDACVTEYHGTIVSITYQNPSCFEHGFCNILWTGNVGVPKGVSNTASCETHPCPFDPARPVSYPHSQEKQANERRRPLCPAPSPTVAKICCELS